MAWPDRLFVVDPALIIASVERLQRKGSHEVMAGCPTRADADEWLDDRIARLCPELSVTTSITLEAASSYSSCRRIPGDG